jgi:hypothetical protein
LQPAGLWGVVGVCEGGGGGYRTAVEMVKQI